MSDKGIPAPAVDVPALVAGVVAALGDGWTTEPGHTAYREDGYLVHPTIGKLHVRLEGDTLAKRKRVMITGQMPAGFMRFSDADAVSITVSCGRGPEAVARTIRTQVLPAHVEAVARAEAGIDSYRQDAQKRDDVVRDLLDAFPDDLRKWARLDQVAGWDDTVELRLNRLDGVVTVRPGGKVTLRDVKIPADMLGALIAAVSATVREGGQR